MITKKQAVPNVWEMVELAKLVTELTTQRDKAIAASVSMRKELENVKEQLVDAQFEVRTQKQLAESLRDFDF